LVFQPVTLKTLENCAVNPVLPERIWGAKTSCIIGMQENLQLVVLYSCMNLEKPGTCQEL